MMLPTILRPSYHNADALPSAWYTVLHTSEFCVNLVWIEASIFIVEKAPFIFAQTSIQLQPKPWLSQHPAPIPASWLICPTAICVRGCDWSQWGQSIPMLP